MKVMISQKQCELPYDDDDEFRYDLNAVLSVGEDTNATQTAYMFAKAMIVEGYVDSSIARAFYEVAQTYAEKADIELEENKEEEEW